jgi:Protein kinase domain
MSVRAGTRLDGRYRLSDRIAVGGMGEVWRGSDEVLGRPVAVKVLRAELAEDDAFRRRFRAEARTAGSLPHNGIAAVFDYGETSVGLDGSSPSSNPVQGDNIAYLVMELVPGEALSTTLAREGALGTSRTLSVLGQAARALHAAHVRGVVHRDVKPANLMVTPEGRVKVTDFGIARPVDHEPLTMTGQVMGTAHYLAPELARGQDASPLSDVYALGVVAYECLAGHRPFEGDNQVLVATAHLSQEPPPLPETLPADVVAVVGAAMAKDPTQRIPSAEALAVAFERLAAHDPRALDGVRLPAGGQLGGGVSPFGGPRHDTDLGQEATTTFRPVGVADTRPGAYLGNGRAPTQGLPPGPAGVAPGAGGYRSGGREDYDFRSSYGGPQDDGQPGRGIPIALWAAAAMVAAVLVVVLALTLFRSPPGSDVTDNASVIPSAKTLGPTKAPSSLSPSTSGGNTSHGGTGAQHTRTATSATGPTSRPSSPVSSTTKSTSPPVTTSTKPTSSSTAPTTTTPPTPTGTSPAAVVGSGLGGAAG